MDKELWEVEVLLANLPTSELVEELLEVPRLEAVAEVESPDNRCTWEPEAAEELEEVPHLHTLHPSKKKILECFELL